MNLLNNRGIQKCADVIGGLLNAATVALVVLFVAVVVSGCVHSHAHAHGAVAEAAPADRSVVTEDYFELVIECK